MCGSISDDINSITMDSVKYNMHWNMSLGQDVLILATDRSTLLLLFLMILSVVLNSSRHRSLWGVIELSHA